MMIPTADRRRAFKLGLILSMKRPGERNARLLIFGLRKFKIQENGNERNVQLAG